MSSEPHPPRPRDPMRANVGCGGRDAEIAVSRVGGAAVVETRSPRQIRGGRRRPAVKGGPDDGWMMSNDIRAMAIGKGLVRRQPRALTRAFVRRIYCTSARGCNFLGCPLQAPWWARRVSGFVRVIACAGARHNVQHRVVFRRGVSSAYCNSYFPIWARSHRPRSPRPISRRWSSRAARPRGPPPPPRCRP